MRQALSSKTGRTPATRGSLQSRTWVKEIPAPTRGLVTNRNLSRQGLDEATKLDNWVPTRTGARVRGGNAKHGTIGSDAVKSMFTYQSGATEELYAADDSGIYEVTSFADPDVAPSAVVSGLSGGYWTFVQLETSGGDFLVGVNGEDAPKEYDGSSWSNGALTGSDLTVSSLSHVWAFKSRLFFVESGSMRAWYLGVGLKSGTLTSLSFAGIFKRGGSLMLGATWSLDAGDGLDDYCVFVSTLGEVAIYQGTDPSSASTWSIVGRYDIARPMGKNALMQPGGDLLLATADGLVPISQAISKDREALKLVAVSDKIEPTWLDEVDDRGSLPWDVIRWDEKNIVYVAMPSPGASVPARCYIVNQLTGAWAPHTGMDMHCAAVLNGQLYWGDGAGTIYQAESGGSDNGVIYTCDYIGPYTSPARGSALNVAQWMRASIRATKGFESKFAAAVDYADPNTSAPGSVADANVDVWDSGLWDTAIWDGEGSATISLNWRSVFGEGDSVAPQILMTFGVSFKPDAEIIKSQLRGYSGADVI